MQHEAAHSCTFPPVLAFCVHQLMRPLRHGLFTSQSKLGARLPPSFAFVYVTIKIMRETSAKVCLCLRHNQNYARDFRQALPLFTSQSKLYARLPPSFAFVYVTIKIMRETSAKLCLCLRHNQNYARDFRQALPLFTSQSKLYARLPSSFAFVYVTIKIIRETSAKLCLCLRHNQNYARDFRQALPLFTSQSKLYARLPPSFAFFTSQSKLCARLPPSFAFVYVTIKILRETSAKLRFCRSVDVEFN